jgi:uncharacterized protein YdhG (YjbR/CyaY superfamily)
MIGAAAAIRRLRQPIPCCTMVDGPMSAMDDYLDGLAPDQQAALARVRTMVSELVPDAEDGKSYGMPAFIYAGRPLLGFRAAQKHLSIFPFSPAVIEAVSDRLDGFDLAKGTIRFKPDHPVPDTVLADLIRLRAQEITASS